MPFQENWAPVLTSQGVYSAVTDGTVWVAEGKIWAADGSIKLPDGANRAILGCYGGSLHYLFQVAGGRDPSVDLGLPLPQGEAVLLVTLSQIKYLKIAQQSEPTKFTIQFFNANS
jgi:hypothetical protein